jgi:hypothetical protein
MIIILCDARLGRSLGKPSFPSFYVRFFLSVFSIIAILGKFKFKAPYRNLIAVEPLTTGFILHTRSKQSLQA